MARAPEPANSVYDFLYVDQQRLAQFESQFSQYGNLTELTRSVGEVSSSGRVLNVHVAKVDTTTSGQTSQTRAFDPQWLAPFSLGALGAMVSGLAPAVRAVLGRPGDAFGMTPLLIFREVATHA